MMAVLPAEGSGVEGDRHQQLQQPSINHAIHGPGSQSICCGDHLSIILVVQGVCSSLPVRKWTSLASLGQSCSLDLGRKAGLRWWRPVKCKAAVWASMVQARKHCLFAFAEILAGASKQVSCWLGGAAQSCKACSRACAWGAGLGYVPGTATSGWACTALSMLQLQASPAPFYPDSSGCSGNSRCDWWIRVEGLLTGLQGHQLFLVSRTFTGRVREGLTRG